MTKGNGIEPSSLRLGWSSSHVPEERMVKSTLLFLLISFSFHSLVNPVFWGSEIISEDLAFSISVKILSSFLA
jgi:hypothetical protein